MAEGQAGVLLISVHPMFAMAIATGEKRAEFRRTSPARAVTHVIVYATAPVKAVVAFAEVDHIYRDKPRCLWRQFAGIGGVSEHAFRQYFGSRQTGCAIVFGHVYSLRVPQPLGSVICGVRAPQSYRYLDIRAIEALLPLAVPLDERQTRQACPERLDV